MTIAKIHNNLRNHFQTAVVDVSSNLASTDVAWDNVAFNAQKASDGGAWCRLQILTGESSGLSLGSTAVRAQGIMLASIFTPAEQGDKLALDIAGEIISACNSTTITLAGNTTILRTPSVNPVGRDGSWYQINISIPFQSDHAN